MNTKPQGILGMLGLILRAFGYSLRLAWRYAPSDTAKWVGLNLVRAASGYALVTISSNLASQVQSYGVDFGYGPVPTIVTTLVLLLAFIMIADDAVAKLVWYYSSRWRQTMRFANRKDLNDHYATLDPARIKSEDFDKLRRSIDELPYSWGVRIELVGGLMALLGALVPFLLYGISFLVSEPLLAIVLFVTATPMTIYQFKETAWWWKLNQELVLMHKERSVLERAYNAPTTFVQAKIFNQFPFLREAIDENAREVQHSFALVRLRSLRWGGVTQAVASVGVAVVIYLALINIWKPDGNVGILVWVIPAIRAMAGSLETMVEVFAEQWQSAQAVIDIEEGYMKVGALSVKGGDDDASMNTTLPLTLTNVSFAYPNAPDNQVLKGVTVTIPPGAKVAVIGQNGSGKSTLMQLILRQYDPDEGFIGFGNRSLSACSVAAVARYITALTQGYDVLPRTIGEEIASSRLGQPYDEVRVWQAIKQADLEAVVAECKDGLQTRLSTEFGGRDFSGGQRQRIALARALYALHGETRVLLLDEAEASLDPVSAETVIQNVLNLDSITVLMVTHFVTRALEFDYVLVMEDGQVADFGPPAEVSARGGVFAVLLAHDEKRRGGA